MLHRTSGVILALTLLLATNRGQAQTPAARSTSPAAERAFGLGNYGEAYRLITAAIASCRPPPGQPDHCLSLLQVAPNMAVAADRPIDAERLAQQAFALAERLGEPARPDQVLALVSLGGALISQGRVVDAESRYRQALPVAKSIGGDNPFIAIIENSLSLVLDAQGRFVEAEALHRSSLAGMTKIPGTAAAIPTLTAGLADNLAGQGRFAEAELQYRQAMDLARQVNGERHPVVAQILSSLAVNAQRRGKFAEAEQLFREASAINLEKLGAGHALAGRDASNLASLFLDWGKLREAERSFRAALAISERSGADHPAVASDLGNLGATLRLEGRASEAEALIRRALEIDSAQFGPESPRVAGHYANIAASLEDQGRFAEAEGLRRRALAIHRGEGERNIDAASSAAGLAGNLLAQGKSSEAETLLRQAIDILRVRLGKDHQAMATAYSQLGVLFAKTGRDASAKRAFDRALKIDLGVLGPMAPRTAADYYNLAAISDRMGDRVKAEAAGRRALGIRRAILAPSHPDLANSLRLLGEILTPDRSRRAEALSLFREAMSIARSRRASSFTGEAAAQDLTSVASAQIRARSFDIATSDPLARTFASFIRFASASEGGLSPGNDALRDEAFLAAQDLDVSLAALTMAQTAVRTAAGQGLLAEQVRRQQDLAQRSRMLDRRLIEALAAGRSEQAAALRNETSQTDRDLAKTDAELLRTYPGYSTLIGPTTLEVSQVRQRLRGNEALVMIKPVGDDVILFAISTQRTAWHRIDGGRAGVDADVEQLRCQVDRENCRSPPAAAEAEKHQAFDPAPARRLYDRLIAPLDNALAGTNALYVVTSGALANLPFDMLAGPSGSGWLSDRYAITVLPAVSVLKLDIGHAKPSMTLPFVGYGDPDFGARTITDFVAIPTKAGPTSTGPRRIFGSLAPLPGTRVELSAMAKALGAAESSVVLGDNATEGAIRSDQRLSLARIIAFATHGLLPDDISGGTEPGLVFTPPETASPQDDGILQASEASSMTVAAEWLVLSACNTASGKGGSDSLSALSRAFLYAGAEAVLASHWRVSDEATAALTVEIIATARAHPELGKAQARQLAMKAIRTGRRADDSVIAGWDASWAHPAAWAPFVLIASK